MINLPGADPPQAFIADPHSGSDVKCARANRPGNGNAKACGQAAAQGKNK